LIAVAALLLPRAADAAEACGKLKLFDSVKMRSAGSGLREYVPVRVNGTKKEFLLDTGGSRTQIARPVAEELKLPIRQGDIQMIDLTGAISRDQTTVSEFFIGDMRGTDIELPVSSLGGEAGLVAIDRLMRLDVDLDFASDTMNLILPDHCPGTVIYWKPSVAAVIPVVMNGYQIVVPVLVDGHQEHAVIDTGATDSTLFIDEARRLFDLTMGSDDTPENGVLNGDDTLKTYGHTFKTLSFGDVTVNNPKLTLIPNAIGRNLDKTPLVSGHTKSEKDLISIQDMLIGMDVLRKLHVYFAFGERKMYVSPASEPVPAASAAPQSGSR
jgi:predicted aspartyl protease